MPVLLKYLAKPSLVPDGYTANAVRYPISALFYLPWLVFGIRAGQFRGIWLAALLPTAFNVAMQTLWGWAPYYVDASLLAFMMRLAAIWSIVGAFIIFRDERRLARSVGFWGGTALSLVGFLIMSWGSLYGGSGATWTGITLVFLCGLCFGGYMVSVRAVMGQVDALVFFSLICAYTSIGMLAMSPLGEPGSLLRLSATDAWLLVLSSLTGIAWAHGLNYVAVQRIGVAIGSLMLMVTPFVSTLLSYIFLGERLTAMQWVGGAVLLAGSIVVIQAQSHLHASQPPAGPIPADEAP